MAGSDDKIARLLAKQDALLMEAAAINKELYALQTGGTTQGEDLKRLEQAFDYCWCERYTPGQIGQYVWTYAKDRPQWKRLLRTLQPEDLEARAARYLASNESYYVERRHPFALFASSVNRWGAERTDSFMLGAPPADCRHVPRCRTAADHTQAISAEMRVPR